MNTDNTPDDFLPFPAAAADQPEPARRCHDCKLWTYLPHFGGNSGECRLVLAKHESYAALVFMTREAPDKPWRGADPKELKNLKVGLLTAGDFGCHGWEQDPDGSKYITVPPGPDDPTFPDEG